MRVVNGSEKRRLRYNTCLRKWKKDDCNPINEKIAAEKSQVRILTIHLSGPIFFAPFPTLGNPDARSAD